MTGGKKLFNYAATATSQFLRLASGMLVLVLLARLLGPSGFGQFSLWLAVATMTAVVTNYGFTTYALREIGAKHDRANQLLASLLSAKLLLMAPAACIGIAISTVINEDSFPIFLLLLSAQLFDSFTEFFNIFFRVNSNHKAEGKNALHGASVHLAVFVAISLFSEINAVHCALAFAATRAYALAVTMRNAFKELGTVYPSDIGTAFAQIRNCFAYAIEIFINTVYTQFDAIVVNKLVGPSGLGLYQAGMKLVQGASRAAPIIAQVLLPDLARAHASQHDFSKAAMRMVLVFSGIGLLGGAVLAFGNNMLVPALFGHEYTELTDLMPLFGLVLWMRFTETGSGLVLVAMGLQQRKVWLVFMQLSTLLLVGTLLSQHLGVSGWLWGIVASTCLALASYRRLYLKGLMRVC